MKVDFFDATYKIETCSANDFGICDDDSKPLEPAYVNTEIIQKSIWIAKVKNNQARKTVFLPVDKNIPMKRDNGDDEDRCDGILFPEYDDKKDIIFIELKDQMGNWITSATDQVEATINIFKENHDISVYNKKIAMVANKKHPYFRYSLKDKMQDFYNRNKVRLLIQASISI